jgi:hypothetical protein
VAIFSNLHHTTCSLAPFPTDGTGAGMQLKAPHAGGDLVEIVTASSAIV